MLIYYPSNIIYMLKVNERNIRKRCEICSKLTITTPARRQLDRFGVCSVNVRDISHLFLVFAIVAFEQVNVRWV